MHMATKEPSDHLVVHSTATSAAVSSQESSVEAETCEHSIIPVKRVSDRPVQSSDGTSVICILLVRFSRNSKTPNIPTSVVHREQMVSTSGRDAGPQRSDIIDLVQKIRRVNLARNRLRCYTWQLTIASQLLNKKVSQHLKNMPRKKITPKNITPKKPRKFFKATLAAIEKVRIQIEKEGEEKRLAIFTIVSSLDLSWLASDANEENVYDNDKALFGYVSRDASLVYKLRS